MSTAGRLIKRLSLIQEPLITHQTHPDTQEKLSKMNHLVTYDGTDPIRHPIREFFQELETFFEAKGTATARKHSLLDKLIRNPAKMEYDAAIGVAGGIANPALQGTPDKILQQQED